MSHVPRRRFSRASDPHPRPDQALNIEVRLERGQGILRLRGELDLETVATLRKVARDLEREYPHTIVFDLRELDLIDSAGISELLVARRRGERVGRRVLLATRPGTPTARVVAMTGVDALMQADAGDD